MCEDELMGNDLESLTWHKSDVKMEDFRERLKEMRDDSDRERVTTKSGKKKMNNIWKREAS